MPLKMAEQLIEDEIERYRRELLRNVTTRKEYKDMGFEGADLDFMQECDEDEVEYKVIGHCADWVEELLEREQSLAEWRDEVFVSLAFHEVWLPSCLVPLDGETSTLTTRDAYESYLGWCATVGITVSHSLESMRAALKKQYDIEDMRAGLREYQLADVPTEINRNRIVAQHEANKRLWEHRQSTTCTYCMRRKYDGNRFDRCYWCHRILKDGLEAALAEYLSQDVGWDRTGESMHLAYQRMVERREISVSENSHVVRSEPREKSTEQMAGSKERKPYWKIWLLGATVLVWIVIIIALLV